MSYIGDVLQEYYPHHKLPIVTTEWLIDTDFDNADKCHDWRNHIPAGVRLVWNDLSYDARLACYVIAYENATKEEWD